MLSLARPEPEVLITGSHDKHVRHYDLRGMNQCMPCLSTVVSICLSDSLSVCLSVCYRLDK